MSLTESGLLVGCSLRRYSALVSNAPSTTWMARMSVEAHALAARVLRVDCIDPPLDELQLAEGFRKAAAGDRGLPALQAQRAVDDGADVVIPAEGMLAELLHVNGVRAIGEAPVMDIFGVTWPMPRCSRACARAPACKWAGAGTTAATTPS